MSRNRTNVTVQNRRSDRWASMASFRVSRILLGRCCCIDAARKVYRAWPVTAAASAPLPETSPITTIHSPSSELGKMS